MDSMPKRPRSAGRTLAAVLLATTAIAVTGFADDLQDGIAFFREGKYAEAEARLRGVEGTEAQAYLAASLARQKKYAEAEAPARAALEASPTHEAAVAALGEALVGQKKYDEAIDRLTAAIGRKNDLAYAYFWRGQAYDKKNQAARMVADYQTFLRLAPKSPEAASVQAVLSALR
jgi:tetratricopeptide (TPR) repeat protein